MNLRKYALLPYAAVIIIGLVASCSEDVDGTTSDGTCGITTTATGEVITTLTASARGGGSPFDGEVNTLADLTDLEETAWGDGSLDLHRGHAPIESVLESFLGISHTEMHVMMEDCNMNLAAICVALGFDPENLITTLTASFTPYITQGVANNVITNTEGDEWIERIRTQFSNRVYWEG